MDNWFEIFLLFVQRFPGIAFVWVAFLGGSIGSFMNVVVYRLPRGMSLSQPSSHCPHCNHPIRWYDNIPVLGWLKLRGRCRDCHARIAARYPFVEAMMTAVFVTSCTLEISNSADDVTLFRIAVLHCVWSLTVVSILACVALIVWDQQRVPLKLFVFAVATWGLLVMLQPQPPSWRSRPETVSMTLERGRLDAKWPGMLVATGISLAVERLLRLARLTPPSAAHAAAAISGLTLSVPRAVVVTMGTYLCGGVLNGRHSTEPKAPSRSWAIALAALTWLATLIRA